MERASLRKAIWNQRKIDRQESLSQEIVELLQKPSSHKWGQSARRLPGTRTMREAPVLESGEG
eukprot:6601345-Alexandrium_andersonii.AAC.1